VDNKRLPGYLRKEILKIKTRKDIFETAKVIREKELNTVCSSSRCPNLNLCYSNKTATFLMLGDKCTRKCPFCNIDYQSYAGITSTVDVFEPQKIAYAVKSLNLRHAVITMVTRDDLEDGGARVLVRAVKEIRGKTDCKIVEVLTSDFNGNEKSVTDVSCSGINIFGHNMETVERLYKTVRPLSSYRRSLHLLEKVKKERPDVALKSGIMIGLGEDDSEVFQTIDDLINIGVDFMTIGQYLRPSLKNISVHRFVDLERFIDYKDYAEKGGIKNVFSAPLVRSSFGAEKFFKHSYAINKGISS
jgi:lipoic acid synthetase